jgi:hypothetical protein
MKDGTVLEAIQLWKKNVDREFEGTSLMLYECH